MCWVRLLALKTHTIETWHSEFLFVPVANSVDSSMRLPRVKAYSLHVTFGFRLFVQARHCKLKSVV